MNWFQVFDILSLVRCAAPSSFSEREKNSSFGLPGLSSGGIQGSSRTVWPVAGAYAPVYSLTLYVRGLKSPMSAEDEKVSNAPGEHGYMVIPSRGGRGWEGGGGYNMANYSIL